jgi:NodT family efflux transporter outer membrane factor (OMF) lipoprotein
MTESALAVRHALLAAAVAIALCACSTAPRYARPSLAQPDTWHNAGQPPSPEWPAADWWRAFGAPQLDALILQAHQQNFDLAAAAARIRQADADLQIAHAQLLPVVALDAQWVHGQAPSRKSRGSQATLDASYELDFWGKNRAGVAAARASALASRDDRATLGLSIDSSVALTYFQVLALHDQMNIASNDLSSAARLLKILQARETAGVSSALDVAQQETAVATANARIPPIEAQLQQSTDALALLTGALPESLVIPDGSLADLAVPPISAGIPAELLSRRPDVAEAEAQLVAANANVAAAHAAFLPSVQLTAEGGVASAALSDLLSPHSTLFALVASITQSIFDGGELRGQYQKSQARYDELVQLYRKAAVSAFVDVEDALSGANHFAEEERRQQRATAAAQRAYDISVAQLRAGTIDLVNVLTAQTALFSAEDALVTAKLAQLQAEVSLYKALGGGWQ